MSAYEVVRSAMADAFRITQEPDAVRVVTHALYPSNSFVQVVVVGSDTSFLVSDEGGAIRELAAAGAEVNRPDSLVGRIARAHGLTMHNGVIRCPTCSADALPIAITLVANTSREVADWLFTHLKIKRPRNFRKLVAEYLRGRYEQFVHEEILIGKSNKPHKFDNLISFPAGGRLIVDAVLNEPASINARVVANMDVRNAGYERLEQRIVYDDQDEWSPENLSLLQVGAIVVPFSKADLALSRMGATLGYLTLGGPYRPLLP